VRGMDDEVAVEVLRLLKVWKLLRVGAETHLRDREIACGVSGDRVVVIREGTYGGRGPEIVIDTVIARSFRRGLRWNNETCRVIKAV
jgi:hypothetical protein